MIVCWRSVVPWVVVGMPSNVVIILIVFGSTVPIRHHSIHVRGYHRRLLVKDFVRGTSRSAGCICRLQACRKGRDNSIHKGFDTIGIRRTSVVSSRLVSVTRWRLGGYRVSRTWDVLLFPFPTPSKPSNHGRKSKPAAHRHHTQFLR